jgi:ABC-type transport system involved in cytochrome c biogenesis permease subunit
MPQHVIAWLGYGGITVLVLAWLFVSFTAPSPRRVIAEWIGACGLYTALLALFLSLSHRAQESGSTPALMGFGFLVALFGSGLVVSLVQTLLALRSPEKAPSGVTH